jgi:hypothetical protein
MKGSVLFPVFAESPRAAPEDRGGPRSWLFKTPADGFYHRAGRLLKLF